VLLEERLLALHDPEDDELWLRTLRQFKQEYAFQAGVQLITGRAGIEECNLFLSDLADCMLQHVLSGLLRRFSEKYGSFPGMDVAVVAMGRLGAQELTFHSDVDLMLLYQVSAEAGLSDGEKQLDAGSYFHRFASRYFNALSMLTREGQLYEVDNRLRPHGVQGPLATRFEAFQEYYRESAWVVEIAGLCKARVVATTDSGFASRIEEDIRNVLRLPRERMQLMRDLADIRSKMRKQNPPRNSWDVKHAQGGLIDLDFIAHYLQLLHAHAQPEMLSRHSMRVFESARWLYLMPDEQVHALLQACRIQRDVLSILRLCAQDVSEGLPQYPGLRHFMLKHFETDDTAELAPRLEQLQQEAWSVFCATFLQ
jgi:glutamate-ammonia-ligase adenylyltransferase